MLTKIINTILGIIFDYFFFICIGRGKFLWFGNFWWLFCANPAFCCLEFMICHRTSGYLLSVPWKYSFKLQLSSSRTFILTRPLILANKMAYNVKKLALKNRKKKWRKTWKMARKEYVFCYLLVKKIKIYENNFSFTWWQNFFSNGFKNNLNWSFKN